MIKKVKIGIIGVGYVGGSMQAWLKKKRQVELFVYDKFKKLGSIEEVNRADVIFICVPTPYIERDGFDDSAVHDALSNVNKGKIVVIRSTVVPGSTEKYQKLFPSLSILFSPEFLVAKTAIHDFAHPLRQIIGYTRKSKKLTTNILRLLPKAPFTKTLPATEAELIKYFGNTFLATKVIFANQMYDLCQAFGADYENVLNGAGADPRIGHTYFNVLQDGYRGFGGACLPKDIKALIWLANKHKISADLLVAVNKINEKLRSSI